ncbi:acyltransferase [Dactylosporangium sp. NBC_01737]|uniref:acyltransferase family protein n=1 Tax=Dactylosporangium sp. NBC_01737 TaxID=2975959 RepID=UPI002E133763|nr:acyltransferase [Dactylosporangium sp. NBC_01737]
MVDRYSPRANALGFLRLCLALAVLVGHSWPLGAGRATPGLGFSHGQADVGALAVDGFFVLSGFLVTASAARLGSVRFAWHRCLRIFPGLWVCLLATALLAGLFATFRDAGLFAARNALGQPHQWGIGTLFSDTPYGRLTGGGSVVNGSLWSLSFELFWYAVLTALTACGVIRRSPRLILLLTAGAYAVLLSDFLHQLPATPYTIPQPRGTFGPIPFFGSLNTQTLVYLGFLFLLGASAQLYQHRVPAHPLLAAAAAAVLLATLRFGAFHVLGYPALAYLLLWAACTLPPWTHRIGRDRDYSYGIYIYAFPTQQVMAALGVHHWGLPAYIAASAAATTLLAAASWHLVERPALRLKHWTPFTRLNSDRPDLDRSGRSVSDAQLQPLVEPQPSQT